MIIKIKKCHIKLKSNSRHEIYITGYNFLTTMPKLTHNLSSIPLGRMISNPNLEMD